MTLEESPEFMRVTQAAELLGISRSQAWRMVWAGDLPSIRLSEKLVRVRRSDLVVWIETKAAASLA